MMNETVVVTVDRPVAPPPSSQPAAPKPAGAQPPGGALGWVQFNVQYFMYTIPGYLKIAQLVGVVWRTFALWVARIYVYI